MPLDGLTLGFLARESQELIGGRIDRVSQPEKDMAVLLIRSGGKNHRLLISASPSMARFHQTDETYQNPPDAPMFCMLMRKYLIGGRVMSVEQLYGTGSSKSSSTTATSWARKAQGSCILRRWAGTAT